MKGRSIAYTQAMMAWLEANRLMVISDYHAAFQAAFARPEISALNLHSLRKRKGWKTGREGNRYKGRHRKFSAAEMAWLGANKLLPIADYHRAFVSAFPREDVHAGNLHALRKRMGWKTGRTGHFEPGHAPANKGKACAPGSGGRHPNAQRTQFKKGQEPRNTKYLGHERTNSDGYVEISVAETNPYTGYHRRYVHKHVHLWEARNGPVPDGHCLKCLDGNKANTAPENWELISRGVLSRLNGGPRRRRVGYDAAPVDLKPTLLVLAQVEQRVFEIRNQGCEDLARTDDASLGGLG